jgi:hypothetical protein
MESMLIDGTLTPAAYLLFASTPLTAQQIREAHKKYGPLLIGFDAGGVPRDGAITNDSLRDALACARSINAELEIYVEGPGGATGNDWEAGEVKRVKAAAKSVGVNTGRDSWMKDWDSWGWKKFTFTQLARYREMGFNSGEIDNLDRVLKTTDALIDFYKEYAERQLAGDLPQLVMKNVQVEDMRAVAAAIKSNQLPRSAFSDFHIFECGRTNKWQPVDEVSSQTGVGIRTVPSRNTYEYDAQGEFGAKDAFNAAIRNEQGGGPAA